MASGGKETVSGIRESLDPVSHDRLRRFLERAHVERFTGTLKVYGRPGGALNLRNGQVMAAVSPGAPGVQALLVRTGRVGDEDRARVAGVARPAAGAIGAARLQVMQVMATQDALFAMLAGTVDSCSFENEGKALEGTGDDPGELLDRAFRKLEALAKQPQAILPHRERLALTDAATRPDPATPEATGSDIGSIRENILRYADGRRTARDIAFGTARSLYVVTIEMSRMLAEGLLREVPSPPVEASPEVLPPRPAPRTQRSADPVPEPGRPEFPRRQPSGRRAADSPGGGARRGFLWLGGRSGDRPGDGRT